MEMTSVYKEFNHTLKTFIREMIYRFPEVNELKLILGLYKMMKTINKKSPQKYFHMLIAEKHSNDIIKKNYEYFLSEEFDDKEISYLLKPMKEKFKTITDEEKEIIWKHMIILLACNKNCQLEQKI